MFSSFRLYLVILLVMLQCIAPLVHAHAGDSRIKPGLHVPGLELYGMATAFLVNETEGDDSSSDSDLFGVDAGIKQSQDNPLADAGNSPYLPQSIAVFTPPFSTCSTAVSPRSPPSVGCLSTPSHAPRAPPSQP